MVSKPKLLPLELILWWKSIFHLEDIRKFKHILSAEYLISVDKVGRESKGSWILVLGKKNQGKWWPLGQLPIHKHLNPTKSLWTQSQISQVFAFVVEYGDELLLDKTRVHQDLDWARYFLFEDQDKEQTKFGKSNN